MNKQLMTFCSLFLAFTGVCTAAGSSPDNLSEPGQPVSLLGPQTLMRSSSTSFVAPSTRFDITETRHERTMNRIWVASLAAVAASSSMDAATSWGKREGNGLLASSNGTFGARGLSIKAGMLAVVVVPQVMFRHHKELKSKFAIGNFAEAGIFTGVAIHNLGVTAPH